MFVPSNLHPETVLAEKRKIFVSNDRLTAEREKQQTDMQRLHHLSTSSSTDRKLLLFIKHHRQQRAAAPPRGQTVSHAVSRLSTDFWPHRVQACFSDEV